MATLQACATPTADGRIMIDQVWIEPEDYKILDSQGAESTIGIEITEADAEKIRHLQHSEHRHILDGNPDAILTNQDYGTLQLCWMALYDSLDRIACD